MAITGETIWITGASSGIGRSLALALAESNNKVIVSARSVDALEALAEQNPNIKTLPFDVTQAELIPTITAKLNEFDDHLDRVILNAGTCEYFDIEQPDWQMTQRIMNVNFQGTVNSFAAALPLMKKGSHLVGVVSLATAAPFTRAQAYGASKAAMKYWLSTMAVDLASHGIDVTTIHPGFVKTPLTDQNDFEMPFLLGVDEAVKIITDKLGSRPRVISFPKRFAFMLKALNFFPGVWLNFVAPRLSKA